MITVSIKTARELTLAESIECRRLSFRHRGLLDEWMVAARDAEYRWPETIVRIFDGPVLVAWGMTHSDPLCECCSAFDPEAKAIGIYTRKTHRKRGLGALVLALLQANHPGVQFRVSQHSKQARALYARGIADGTLKRLYF